MHRHRHRRRPITTSEHPSMDFKGETLRTMHKITSGRHDLHAPPPDFQFTMPPRFFPSSKDFISTSIFSSTATIPEQTGREASAYDIAPYRSEAHNSQQTSLLPRSIFDTNIGLFSEASKVISFLHQYPVPHQFAITSFSQPVCAISSIGNTTQPAMISYVNTAFARLVQCSREELIGLKYSDVFVINQHDYKNVAHLLVNRPPISFSDVIQFRTLLMTKNRRLLRTKQNCQFFYDRNGTLKETLICLMSWEDGQVEDGEVIGQWIPLPAMLNNK